MFTELLEKVVRHEDLTEAEAAGAMREVMEGRAPAASLAALLAALVMKGERPAEIVGFAKTMREHAVKLSASPGEVFDTCGTGGDRSGTFNISSAAALVIAAAGVKVAKHGNRSVSSRCGSADVFEQLGVNIAAPPAVVERTLQDANIAFFFARTFHPAMKHAAQTRQELGIRTAFNLLGPLTNPAGARRQIVGVPRSELTELLARALLMLGSERAWVVHGADGIDEISTTGYTKVSECRDGAVHTFYIHPSDFGVPKASPADLQGGDAARNAEIVREVLGGTPGAARDVVLLNAGRGVVRRRPRVERARRHRAAPRRRSTRAPRRPRSIAWRAARRRRPPYDRPRLICSGRSSPPRSASCEVRREREPAAALEARAATGVAAGAAFEQALGMAGRVNVIAECKRRSPSKGVLAAEYDRAVDRTALRAGRRGRHLGADRADVLRRRARASGGGPARRRAAAPAQGLHRRRVPAVRGACRTVRMPSC